MECQVHEDWCQVFYHFWRPPTLLAQCLTLDKRHPQGLTESLCSGRLSVLFGSSCQRRQSLAVRWLLMILWLIDEDNQTRSVLLSLFYRGVGCPLEWRHCHMLILGYCYNNFAVGIKCLLWPLLFILMCKHVNYWVSLENPTSHFWKEKGELFMWGKRLLSSDPCEFLILHNWCHNFYFTVPFSLLLGFD